MEGVSEQVCFSFCSVCACLFVFLFVPYFSFVWLSLHILFRRCFLVQDFFLCV